MALPVCCGPVRYQLLMGIKRFPHAASEFFHDVSVGLLPRYYPSNKSPMVSFDRRSVHPRWFPRGGQLLLVANENPVAQSDRM